MNDDDQTATLDIREEANRLNNEFHDALKEIMRDDERLPDPALVPEHAMRMLAEMIFTYFATEHVNAQGAQPLSMDFALLFSDDAEQYLKGGTSHELGAGAFFCGQVTGYLERGSERFEQMRDRFRDVVGSKLDVLAHAFDEGVIN